MPGKRGQFYCRIARYGHIPDCDTQPVNGQLVPVTAENYYIYTIPHYRVTVKCFRHGSGTTGTTISKGPAL